MSVLNTIFITRAFYNFSNFLYIKYYEKKIFNYKIKKYHQRGLYEVLTAICFFTGLILLPVAEVYTLLMTNPFFVTIFAFYIFKRKSWYTKMDSRNNWIYWSIIVINPQNMNFNFLYIFPIIAAIFLTIRDIKTKNIANENNSFDIIFITSLLMTVFSGFGSLFSEFTFKLEYF